METLDRVINELTEEIDTKVVKRIVDDKFESQSRFEPVKPDLLTRSQRRKRNAPRDIELSVEDKLTVDAIKLRGSLDPSRFYKKKSTEKIGKNFQIGTIIEHPVDYYSSRATRKERKQTLVDELIADAEFKKNVKGRYRRLRASDAIKKREKVLAERRKLRQSRAK